MGVNQIISANEAQVIKNQIARANKAIYYGWICTTDCLGDHEPGTPCRHKGAMDGAVFRAYWEWDEQCEDPIAYRRRHSIPHTEAVAELVEHADEVARTPLMDWKHLECEIFGMEIAESKLYKRYERVLHEIDWEYDEMSDTRHEEVEKGDLVELNEEIHRKRVAFLAKTKIPYSMRLKFARQDLELKAKQPSVWADEFDEEEEEDDDWD